MFGTFAGAYAITRLDNGAMSVVLGVLVLLAVAISLSGWRAADDVDPRRGRHGVGVMGTMTSVGGPPMALVYQRAGRQAALDAGQVLPVRCLPGVGDADAQRRAGRPSGGRRARPAAGLLVGLAASRQLAPYLDRGWTRAAVLDAPTVAATVLVVGGLI